MLTFSVLGISIYVYLLIVFVKKLLKQQVYCKKIYYLVNFALSLIPAIQILTITIFIAAFSTDSPTAPENIMYIIIGVGIFIAGIVVAATILDFLIWCFKKNKYEKVDYFNSDKNKDSVNNK